MPGSTEPYTVRLGLGLGTRDERLGTGDERLGTGTGDWDWGLGTLWDIIEWDIVEWACYM